MSDKQDPASANIATHAYAQRVQALIKLITDLRALGAQSVVDLPSIAVIGNQSAGKSSLVEAMTKIAVPRAQGTCTRCPMECRLKHSSEPFKCQIFLRIEKDEFGEPMKEVREVKFGNVLHDKGELEVMLRRAQLAILNPSISKERFVNLDLDSLRPGETPFGSDRQLQFSANVVCVDISSPDVTNLSFIDLPGIISNVAEGEDPSNIDLIKDLVREHIRGNTLILLTITMRDDIQNQAAALLAKDADPKGTRTIGVLTKPDTLQDGEHGEWLDVLAGRKHPLTHGYFVTKQAGPAQLKVTYEENRQHESQFFRTSPWCDQDSRIRGRMGVPNLTTRLSTLLSQLIEKTLPKLRADARNSLGQVSRDLKDLPPLPSNNPTAELFLIISTFDSQLQQCVRGQSHHENLIQKCRRAYEAFKEDILTTRPNFVPFLREEIEEDTEQNPDIRFSTEQRDILEEDSELKIGPVQCPTYIDEVRDCIRHSTTRELPYNVPYRAKVDCIEASFEMWQLHAQNCFLKVANEYQTCLYDLIEGHFKKYSHGGLYDEVRKIIDSELDRVKIVALNRMEWLLNLEEDPFTLNEHYLSDCRQKFLTSFKGQRQEKQGKSAPHPDDVKKALASLGALGINCCEDDLARLGGPDPYETELIVMAEVAAYFRVAYKRIIDDLPRAIDLDFLKGLQKGVSSALINGLRLDDQDSKLIANRLLSEDPDITSRRHSLLQVKERFETISSKLSNFATLGI